MQVPRAIQSDKIDFNILSQEFADMHQVRYKSCTTSIGPYRIIGYVVLLIVREDTKYPDHVPGARSDYWYVTSDELPYKAQAVVSASLMRPAPPELSFIQDRIPTHPGIAATGKGQDSKPGRASTIDTEYDDRMLKSLMGMGWLREDSIAALVRFDNDLIRVSGPNISNPSAKRNELTIYRLPTTCSYSSSVVP